MLGCVMNAREINREVLWKSRFFLKMKSHKEIFVPKLAPWENSGVKILPRKSLYDIEWKS